jgi:hypothetical protein
MRVLMLPAAAAILLIGADLLCAPSVNAQVQSPSPGRHGPAVEYSGSKARRGSSRRPAGDHSQAGLSTADYRGGPR